jgi:hypothetical protein
MIDRMDAGGFQMQGLHDFRRAEFFLYSILFTMFLAANLITSARSPVIWQDEVMFADPAVNLYLGHGFTTSAWFQPRDTVFAGNSPLYSLCLYPWMCLFGFSVVAVRALNYVLILSVIIMCWLGLDRLGLVRDRAGRLVFALLVLCGDGVAYSYRSGRYDCLGMLIVACMCCALSVPATKPRRIALFLLTALIPTAGLQLIPYLAFMGLFTLLVRGRSVLPDLLAVACGGLAGLISFGLLLLENGVWPELLKSVSILGGARRPIAARLTGALAAPFSEPSSIVLLVLLCLCLMEGLKRADARLRSLTGAGLIVGILVPCLMAIAGKYGRYYSWMACIPMAACVAAQFQTGRTMPILRSAVPFLVFLACAVGLPARLAVTCLEWKLRAPEPVDQLVAENIQPTDWVYSEFEAYYPAKKTAAVLFLPPYAGLIPEMEGTEPPLSACERERVDVLILKPPAEEKTFRYFGGSWRLVGRYTAELASSGKGIRARFGGSKPYDLMVYRRRE